MVRMLALHVLITKAIQIQEYKKLVKELLLCLVREKIVRMNYQKHLFCVCVWFGLVGPLLEIASKFITSYKTYWF